MNIIQRLQSIPQDKLLHFSAGAVIAAAFAPFGFRPLVAGVILSIVAGVLKEVMDKRYGGDPSVWDAAATALGGLAIGAWFYFGPSLVASL